MAEAKPWLKDGRPLMRGGHPVLCAECPCGARECAERASAYAARLLDDAERWALVASYSSSFSCAEWAWDDTMQAWRLVSPSSGTLLAAVPHGASPDVSQDAVPLISATVLYDRQAGRYLTVGCRCVPDAATRECRQTLVALDGWDVAGAVPVFAPQEASDSGSDPYPSYTPEDACAFDSCALYEAWLQALARWHGGEYHGEGFADWWEGGRPQEEWEMQYYYRFSVHRAAYVYATEGAIATIILPCDCSGLASGTLASGMAIHDMEGICGVEGDCLLQVMMHTRWYLDMGLDGYPTDSSDSGDRLWVQVYGAASDYSCAEYAWDEAAQSYVRVTAPSGHLLLAFSMSRDVEWGTMQYMAYPAKLTIAAVLRNTQTGAYRTLGCRCNYDSYSRQCSPQFADLSGYKVCGVLPVVDDAYDQCRVDACLSAEMCLDCLAAELGGTLYGEGFIETTSPSYSYTRHRKAYVFQAVSPFTGSSVDVAVCVPCECSDMLPAYDITGKSVRSLPGVCSSSVDCPDYWVLRASALANGWTWGEEGFLAHKASCQYYDSAEGAYRHAVGDWFAPSAYATGRASALAGTRMYIVSCSCDAEHAPGYHISSVDLTGWGDADIGPADETPAPSGYWAWTEYPGACSCLDWRELILDDPARWGALDISYGTHTKYTYTYTWTETDPVTFEEITHTETVYDTVGHRETSSYANRYDMYLDYRTFCWIQRVLRSSGGACAESTCIRSVSPEGSPAAAHDRQHTASNTHDGISFAGHAQPFAHDADLDWDWAGSIAQWDGGGCGCQESGGCYGTEAEAQAVCSAASPTGCGSCSAYASLNSTDLHFAARVSPPDASQVYHAGRVEEIGTQWCCWLPYYTIGRQVSQGGRTYHVVYREQWIDTNLGLLRYGVGGHVPSLTVYGILDYNADWSCYNAICHDTTVSAEIVDDDMHACEGHDPDWQRSESQ